MALKDAAKCGYPSIIWSVICLDNGTGRAVLMQPYLRIMTYLKLMLPRGLFMKFMNSFVALVDERDPGGRATLLAVGSCSFHCKYPPGSVMHNGER